MPNNYILKDFDGGAQKTTLAAALNSSDLSFSVTDGNTFPAGSNPFVVVIDRGLASEEKLLISSRTGNSFVVLERAYDGSSAQPHVLGSTVEHALDAFTVEQANRFANLQTSKGDLVVHDGSTTQRLAVGSNSTVLVADSAQGSGVKWAQLEAASIGAAAISDIATAVELLISPAGVPAGVITQFAGSSAPTGWLMCDGSSVSTTTYSTLHAAIGYQYGGSGSSFTLPNLKGKVPVGRDATQGEFDNLGETGGAKTHTLLQSEMPVHTHTATSSTTGSHVHAMNTGYELALNAGNNLFANSGNPPTSDAGDTQSAGSHNHTITVANAGSGGAHNNLQPYIVVNYIIKT